MDEEYLAKDPAVRELSEKGADFTEEDKAALLDKQHELLAAVLPEYRGGGRARADRNFDHAVLPSDPPAALRHRYRARLEPALRPLPHPPFRYPEDAREQLAAGAQFHERIFGKPPAGLWPSEGSVSDQALEIATELGFKWFATDEGVLGRTRISVSGGTPAAIPENGRRPVHARGVSSAATKQMSGFFRDHYLSDLVGFVYSRMGAEAAAEDLHRAHPRDRRSRAAGPNRNRQPDPRRRKCLGILSRQRPRFPAQVLRAHRARSRKSGADGERSDGGRGRASRTSRAFSRPPGSARISMSGSATRKTCAPGICCATRATPTSERSSATNRAANPLRRRWTSAAKARLRIGARGGGKRLELVVRAGARLG